MAKIDHEIMSAFQECSGMFRHLILPFDDEQLEADRIHFASRFTNDLCSNFSPETVNANSRVIQNYSLFCSSLKQLLQDFGLPIEMSENHLKDLYQYFLTSCIPETLWAIQRTSGEKGIIYHNSQTLQSHIVDQLQLLAPREFFQVSCFRKPW